MPRLVLLDLALVDGETSWNATELARRVTGAPAATLTGPARIWRDRIIMRVDLAHALTRASGDR